METPYMEVVRFDAEDVIATSGDSLVGVVGLYHFKQNVPYDGGNWQSPENLVIYRSEEDGTFTDVHYSDLYNNSGRGFNAGEWYHVKNTYMIPWENSPHGFYDTDLVNLEPCTDPNHHGLAGSSN